MNINSARLIYFSPTKTTKKVIEAIAQGILVNLVERLDLTPPESRTRSLEIIHDELAIIGAPVYSGRIPPEAKYRLQRIKANDIPAVIVVTYGNREYEDALLELKNIAAEAGFRPVAGGAFIGEHSFNNDTTPIAQGRPDKKDLGKAIDFGKAIRKKIHKIRVFDEISPLQVPGNFPYKERFNPIKMSPVTQETLCTKCQECEKVCPTAAISVGDKVITDHKACILCCACIKSCPTKARIWEEPWIEQIAEWLSTNYDRRKEPETYL